MALISPKTPAPLIPPTASEKELLVLGFFQYLLKEEVLRNLYVKIFYVVEYLLNAAKMNCILLCGICLTL